MNDFVPIEILCIEPRITGAGFNRITTQKFAHNTRFRFFPYHTKESAMDRYMLAVEHSESEFIVFCEPDDLFNQDSVDKLLEQMGEDVAVVHSRERFELSEGVYESAPYGYNTQNFSIAANRNVFYAPRLAMFRTEALKAIVALLRKLTPAQREHLYPEFTFFALSSLIGHIKLHGDVLFTRGLRSCNSASTLPQSYFASATALFVDSVVAAWTEASYDPFAEDTANIIGVDLDAYGVRNSNDVADTAPLQPPVEPLTGPPVEPPDTTNT